MSTEQTDGGIFAQTVILLLSYDDAGAAGLVVNRPTDVKASELFSGESPLSAYDGTIYWGGPVQMDTLLALSNTDRPPDGAEKILDSVYVVPFSEDVIAAPGVRLFIGYTGWAAGQLDSELARGSWQVVPASGDGVFSKDPAGLWKRLLPRETIRAELSHAPEQSVRLGPPGVCTAMSTACVPASNENRRSNPSAGTAFSRNSSATSFSAPESWALPVWRLASSASGPM